jgi:hypothetical protein
LTFGDIRSSAHRALIINFQIKRVNQGDHSIQYLFLGPPDTHFLDQFISNKLLGNL